MKRTFAFLAAGLTVSALAACSSSPPPPTLTIGTMPAPTVVMDVAGYPAPQGRSLLEVPVTLANPTDGAAIVSGWWYEYGLATKSGLLLSPSTLSNLVGTPCSSDTNVAAGGSFQCNLIFDVPCGDTAEALVYEGAAVTKPLTPPVTADCSPTTGAGGASGTGGSVTGAGGSPAGTGGGDAG